VNAVMNLWVPQNTGNLLISRGPASLWGGGGGESVAWS
jgi:hypothetical protein